VPDPAEAPPSPAERAAGAAPASEEAAEERAEPEGPAVLAGRVVYPGERPAPEARLSLSTRRHGRRDSREIPLDPAGAFRVEDLEPGWYGLRAWTDLGKAAGEAQLIAGAVAEVVLELQPAGAILGLVVDAAGAPLPGLPVALMVGVEEAPHLSEQESGADGRFLFEGVAVGSYTVVVAPPERSSEGEWVFEDLWTAAVEVEEGRTSEVVVRPPERGPVAMHGRVLRGGAPVEGVALYLLREGTTLLGSARFCESADDGSYELSVPEPGAHTLLVGPDGDDDLPNLAYPVTVPDADAFEHDVLLPGGRIEGSVRGPDGKPVRAGLIAEREDHFLELILPDEAEQTQTDDDGRFAIEGLAPGDYLLRVKPHDGRYARSVTPVVVGEGTERVDLELAPAASVVGRVLGPDGQPVADALVHVLDARGLALSQIGLISSNSDGTFECDRLPPGDLTLLARTDDMTSEESALLRVDAGETRELTLRLRPATLLVVRVVDGEGRPLPAGVRALDSRGRDVGAALCPAATMKLMVEGFVSTTKELGPFLPGSYRVEASAPGGRRAAKAVEIVAPGRVELELRLEGSSR
jgi:hypothetical protein